LEAEYRNGRALDLPLRPLLEKLVAAPQCMDGFAAALFDYLLMLQQALQPNTGALYADLTYEQVMEWRPEPEPEPTTNVIAFAPMPRPTRAERF
jgi:hypothetical protein